MLILLCLLEMVSCIFFVGLLLFLLLFSIDIFKGEFGGVWSVCDELVVSYD